MTCFFSTRSKLTDLKKGWRRFNESVSAGI
jgi:hypothetical protein